MLAASLPCAALGAAPHAAGDGGPFWQAWCQAVLPPPEALPLPMCWTPAQLAELQHPAIQQAAEAQQVRAPATLFGRALGWHRAGQALAASPPARSRLLRHALHAVSPMEQATTCAKQQGSPAQARATRGAAARNVKRAPLLCGRRLGCARSSPR